MEINANICKQHYLNTLPKNLEEQFPIDQVTFN